MKRFLLSILMVLPMLFVGCKEDTTTGDASSDFAFDQPKLTFEHEGGELSLNVETLAAWDLSIKADAEWLTATPLKGEGNTEVVFSAEFNEDGDARNTTVKFNYGEGQVKEFLVVQNGNEEADLPLVINPKSLNAAAVGGEYKMSLKCDESWIAIIPNDEEWFSIAPMEAEGDADVTINFARNVEVSERSIDILFKTISGSGSQTLAITQEAFDYSTNIELDPAKFEVTFRGDSYSNGGAVWDFAIYDRDYISSEAAKGYYTKFTLVGDTNKDQLKHGHITGEYIVNTESATSYAIGDMAQGSYSNPRDYYMACYYKSGKLNISKVSDSVYKFEGEFTAADGTVVKLNFEQDITSEEYPIVDDSFNSDLKGSYEQKIEYVSMINNGDKFMRGVNIWNMSVWGDGASNTDAQDGTYLAVQFYTPISQSTPDGTFTVKSEPFWYEANTVEPGYEMSSGGVNGTWLNFYEDGIITGFAPAIEGEMTIESLSDGTYKLSYSFKDDNPYSDAATFSGEYTGAIDVIDRLDMGDFDSTMTTITYVGNKYSKNNSWVLHLQTEEYTSSNGENGMVMEFVLNVTSADQYDSQINECEWNFAGGSEDEYVIYNGSVKSYKDGVASVSEVTGGKIVNTFAENSNYNYYLSLEGITTNGGESYDLYHFCNLMRLDASEVIFPSVDVEDAGFCVANLSYFDENTELGYHNWAVMLIDNRGYVFANLDLFLNTGSMFKDGIPSGTYSYMPNNDAVGVWNTRNNRVTYYNEFATIESGEIVIENKGNNEYTFTLDFDLDRDDAKLTGSFSTTATLIDNSLQ